MDFSFYLKTQLEHHPSMQMQDIIKMCYQATFGVEHMLAAWKAKNLESRDLFDLFVATANFNVPGTETDFDNFAKSAEQLIAEGLFPFSLEEWQNYYTAYKNNGMHPVHHSDAYRLAERPAYRLIWKSLLPADIS